MNFSIFIFVQLQKFSFIQIMSIQEQESILSPRYLFKIISNGIQQLTRNKIVENNVSRDVLLQEYQPYLAKVQIPLNIYRKNQLKLALKQQQEEQQIQEDEQKEPQLVQQSFYIKQDINSLVPEQYFQQNRQLKLPNKSQLLKKQQQLQDFLDDVQLRIFRKTSRRQQRYFFLVTSVQQIQSHLQNNLQKIKEYRQKNRKIINQLMIKQKKIEKLSIVADNKKRLLNYYSFCRKMKALKTVTSQQINQINNQHYKFMQNIKQSDIETTHKIDCLTTISGQLQEYRSDIKQRISQQFQQQLNNVLKQLLTYNKDQWIKAQIPDTAISSNAVQDFQFQPDCMNKSVLNLSILDQSYFQMHVENHQQKHIDMTNLKNFCEIVDIYKIWDDIQVVEIVMRHLLKSNIKFDKDLNDYIDFVLQSKGIKPQKKSKPKTQSMTIKRNLLDYTTFKKNSEKVITSETQPKPIKNKMQYIDIKFYYKLVKVYFELIKHLLTFIRNYRKILPFFDQCVQKIYQFVQGRIQYFLNLKPLCQFTNKDTLIQYLTIIDYWIQQIELYEKLRPTRIKFVEKHLTGLQQRILVKEFRTAIEKSSFQSISIPSSSFVSLDYVLNWTKNPQQRSIKYQKDNVESYNYNNVSLDMSVSVFGQTYKEATNRPYISSTFKVIDKILIVEGLHYRVCDTYLLFIQYMQHYLQLYTILQDLRENIQQKICELVGFYIWYSKKALFSEQMSEDSRNSSKSIKSTNYSAKAPRRKTLRNICVLVSVIELVKHMVCGFEINSKKFTKLLNQIEQCLEEIKKQITMVPLLMIQEQVQLIYESKIKQRRNIPTSETVRIIEIIRSALQCFRDFFDHKKIKILLAPSIRMIHKNYFGYLANMELRGREELKWFLPRIQQHIEQIFSDQWKNMEKQLKVLR